MDVNQITLGGGASQWAAQLGIPESEVRTARATATSASDGLEFLVILGALPDGRRVRMLCPRGFPHHVVSFRLIA